MSNVYENCLIQIFIYFFIGHYENGIVMCFSSFTTDVMYCLHKWMEWWKMLVYKILNSSSIFTLVKEKWINFCDIFCADISRKTDEIVENYSLQLLIKSYNRMLSSYDKQFLLFHLLLLNKLVNYILYTIYSLENWPIVVIFSIE